MESYEYMREAYAAQRHEDVRDEYRRAIAARQVTVAMHLLGSRALRKLGDLRSARLAVDAALQLRPEGNILGECRFQRGLILRETGAYREAVNHFWEFLDGLTGYSDLAPIAEGSAWHNLGLALRCCREMGAAREAYNRAVVCHRREGMDKLRRESLQNLAWTCCLMQEASGAADALAESKPLCDTDEALARQQLGEAHLAFITGHQVRTIRLCDALVAMPSLPADVTSHAYWLSARVALGYQDYEKAQVLANMAQQWAARDRTDSRCMSDVAQVLQQIREAQMAKNKTGECL